MYRFHSDQTNFDEDREDQQNISVDTISSPALHKERRATLKDRNQVLKELKRNSKERNAGSRRTTIKELKS